MLRQIVTQTFNPRIKQRHYRRRNDADDYKPQTVSDGCAKAFIVLVLIFFTAKALWRFMI